MNSTWVKIVLIVSLGLNCMVAGALGFSYFRNMPLGRFFDHRPAAGRPGFFNMLPPKNLAAHQQLRDKMAVMRRDIGAAKDSLLDQLAAPEPDRGRIEAQLGAINALQADMERTTMEQMLQDIQSLPPDKRAEFIRDIRQNMYYRGHGMGRGGRGGRHGQSHFPP